MSDLIVGIFLMLGIGCLACMVMLTIMVGMFAVRASSRVSAIDERFVDLMSLLRERQMLSEVVGIYSERHTSVRSLLEGASKKIRILTTCLSSLQGLNHIFIKKAKEGIPIEIITLNPNHSFTWDRAADFLPKSEGAVNGDNNHERGCRIFKMEMVTAIRDFLALAESYPNIKVYVHRRFPTKMLFQADDRILVGFILHAGKDRGRARSRYQIHVEFEARDRLGVDRASACFEDHFTALLDDSLLMNMRILDWIQEQEVEVGVAGERLFNWEGHRRTPPA